MLRIADFRHCSHRAPDPDHDPEAMHKALRMESLGLEYVNELRIYCSLVFVQLNAQIPSIFCTCASFNAQPGKW
jgi:hypothetical protein